MLYSEIIAVCPEIHTKHINKLCGQNVELLNVKPGGTYSIHWALNVKKFSSSSLQTIPKGFSPIASPLLHLKFI
jgi:hypothetical protein